MFVPILYILVFLVCLGVSARVTSRGARQLTLLAGGYALYCSWSFWFTAVLLSSTIANFLLGKWLQRSPGRAALSTGILLNLALLSSFKYLPPLAIASPFASLERFAHLALPLGISFWTFQAMSYLFDLYRGEELDPSFLEFALYMVFFPVAISGPICRLPDMLPQFRSRNIVRTEQIGRGLARIATGVLMMQFARLLGQGILSGDGITSGFDRLHHWTGPDVWCLAIGFGLQLFFDFAGYSHIAIGAAMALGFVVPENFARPFASVTPSIFWTRWHMSLSFWIRDYVFLPLAMVRREHWWRNLVLVISMVLFGLWHGATILFLLWGCYHGVLLLLHRQVQQLQFRFNWNSPSSWWNPFSWLVTMALISLGWILFRATSLAQATQMLRAVLSPGTYSSHVLSASLYLLVLLLATGYAVVLLITDAIETESETLDSRPTSGAFAVLARHRWYWIPPLYGLTLLLVLIVTLTQSGGAAQLMYRGF